MTPPDQDADQDALVKRLRAAGCVYAEEEAALLREAAIDPHDPTHPTDPQALEDLVAARVAGTPLEVLVGWVDLDGVRVRTAPRVFVPRQRSLLLVHLTLAHLQHRSSPLVVDLCCGGGGLGTVIGVRRPDAAVHAADLDPAAVACARTNLPAERVHQGDLYAALPRDLVGRVDALVVNAPYVPSDAVALMPPEARDHEELIALDGGTDGLDLHRRVAAGAPRWLAPGGALLLETSREQAPVSAALLRSAGLVTTTHHDAERGGTAVLGVLPAPP